MKLRDLISMAMENLLRKKLRTSLTILSIVIGTISIILMMALGDGMQTLIRKGFDSYGSLDVLEVTKGNEETKTSRFRGINLTAGLTDQDVIALKNIEQVKSVAPLMSTGARIQTSQYYNDIMILGIDPYLMEDMGFKIMEGRLLQDDIRFEAIFGDMALESFTKIPSDNPNAVIQRPEAKEDEEEDEGITINLGGETVNNEYVFNPLEERYKLQLSNMGANNQTDDERKLYSFSGVGILKAGDVIKDYNVYVSLSVLEKLLKSSYEAQGLEYKPSYSQMMVKVKDVKNIKEVEKAIKDLGYSVFSLMSILDSLSKTMNSMKVALGAIGGISLFVAAIGITNTMVMAISERRKEIGVMKVIGATLVDIKRLFLLESALIGMIGGGVGITLCIAISKFISSDYFSRAVLKSAEGGFSFTIPNSLILGGLLFTTFIGMASGYLPALKAMKCSALEAIRND